MEGTQPPPSLEKQRFVVRRRKSGSAAAAAANSPLSNPNNTNNSNTANNNDNDEDWTTTTPTTGNNNSSTMVMKTYTNQPSLDVEMNRSIHKTILMSNSGSSDSADAAGQQRRPLLPSDRESSKDESPRSYSDAAGFKECSAILLYSFCSISMILVNKSLASSYNHLIDKGEGTKGDLNTLLVVIQAAAAVVFMWGCKLFNLVDYPELKFSLLKSWAPVNIFFCLMLFTGMASLQTNSVPMVTVFKNVANITTATADYFLFGNLLEPLSKAAFVVMLLGAIAASWNDMQTSFTGLFWMLFNCLATTGYVCYMRYATQSIKLSKFGMVYVNNVLCVMFLVPVALLTGEFSMLLRSTALHTWDYTWRNLFAGFVGFFLNFASLNCVSVTGPTTYAIVGSLNKVPVTFLGYFMFDERLTGKTWFFVGVALVGGFMYTYAQLHSRGEEKKQVEADPEAGSRK